MTRFLLAERLKHLQVNEVGLLVNRLTPLTTIQTPVASIEVKQYPDKLNASWKHPYVQAWLHSFQSGSIAGMLQLDRSVFGTKLRPDLMALALKYERSWLAQGTESTKALGQVRGSTRKPFAQKGRGKARVGTIRSPQFVGGYTVHGPRPHDKTTDIQRKVYSLAIRSALSAKFAQSQLIVVDCLQFLTNNADKMHCIGLLRQLGISGRKSLVLHGHSEPDSLLMHSFDSFTKRDPYDGVPEGERPILYASARHVSVGSLLDNEILVLDKEGVEVLEEMYRVKQNGGL